MAGRAEELAKKFDAKVQETTDTVTLMPGEKEPDSKVADECAQQHMLIGERTRRSARLAERCVSPWRTVMRRPNWLKAAFELAVRYGTTVMRDSVLARRAGSTARL